MACVYVFYGCVVVAKVCACSGDVDVVVVVVGLLRNLSKITLRQ